MTVKELISLLLDRLEEHGNLEVRYSGSGIQRADCIDSWGNAPYIELDT